MNYWKIMILGVCLLFFAGCGTNKPDGIPAIHPVSITITKGTTPVGDAQVLLTATTAASGSWSVSGTTNSSGVATITTSQGEWKEKGAPEGEYKVYITKLAKLDAAPPIDSFKDEESARAFAEERNQQLAAITREIPESLTSPATSDLKITVVAKTGAKETFDIGKYKFE